MTEDFGPKFMLQEYTRIIDAYHDLHRQKDALIKLYLTFFSLPVSVLALFLGLSRFIQGNSQPGSITPILSALQDVGILLSLLLEGVSIAVLMVMLMIRGEQYLYVKTINGTRQYFKEECSINPKYLVLPSDVGEITFGQEELWGRAFWEAMIVTFTSCLILGFLSYELLSYLHVNWPFLAWAAGAICLTSGLCFCLFVRWFLKRKLVQHGLIDVAIEARPSV